MTNSTGSWRKQRRFSRKGIQRCPHQLRASRCGFVVSISESAGSLSPRSVANMKAEIESERLRLMATKGLAEGERNQAQKDLEEREVELQKAQEQQQELERKLGELNSKVGRYCHELHLTLCTMQVIKGGVNLLEQAEHQERLLESSAKELDKRKKKEHVLRQQLHQKEAEKLDIEEKYATLQEEAAGKTRILKEVWKEFQQTKEEVSSRG